MGMEQRTNRRNQKWVDELYVIFPFELKLFQEKGVNTHYVGNPLQDAVCQFIANEEFLTKNQLNKPYIALLAGSRKQEIKSAMPVFNQLKLENPQWNFVVAGLKEWQELYKAYSIPVVYDETYDLLSHAEAAVVTSGTATLETGLFKVPQIVVYKTDWLFYSLAKLLVKIKFISLVNIILDKLAVPELIQAEFTSQHIQWRLKELMNPTSLLGNSNYQIINSLLN